jgi:hypothetical protein
MFDEDDCCPTPLQEAATVIAKHLAELYNDRSHKDEIPTCIVCMSFFMGTQNADALE